MSSNSIDLNDLDQSANELGIGGTIAKEPDEESYKKRMQQRQQVQQLRVNQRDQKKGLIVVFTGQGKGKTTAALGMALRTLGHNKNVAIVQFIKGGWEPGEAKALKVFGDALKWHAAGEGFTWKTQDRQRDKQLVSKAWEISLDYLRDSEQKLVILDEINVAIKLGYLNIEDVIKGLSKRPPLTHAVLTGRGAPERLIKHADLVTEMTLIHHPFKEQGVKAQAGVEF